MGRIMAIDVGQKRVGLAVTDPLRIIATGLDTVNVSEVFGYISDYFSKEKIDLFVVGTPLQMNNLPSEAVKYTEPFIKKLEKEFPGVPVKRVDERFTSRMAGNALISGGAGRKKRRDKALKDKISAVIILQSFLAAENKLIE